MTTQHTDETRDFENFLIEEMGPHVLAGDKMSMHDAMLKAWQTATASAEAKYAGVVYWLDQALNHGPLSSEDYRSAQRALSSTIIGTRRTEIITGAQEAVAGNVDDFDMQLLKESDKIAQNGIFIGPDESEKFIKNAMRYTRDELVERMCCAANATPNRRIVTERIQKADGTVISEKIDFIPMQKDRMRSALAALEAIGAVEVRA